MNQCFGPEARVGVGALGHILQAPQILDGHADIRRLRPLGHRVLYPHNHSVAIAQQFDALYNGDG
ncbi:hypothetical protein [Variovorax sp. OV700]|uniref:hypothetical protein n=1 Tax=Variovorax sp. OV700 TaxID=1882826 RepID=UPI001587918E|nr:hypothetical protein [Variovorax sp. OV700]